MMDVQSDTQQVDDSIYCASIASCSKCYSHHLCTNMNKNCMIIVILTQILVIRNIQLFYFVA